MTVPIRLALAGALVTAAAACDTASIETPHTAPESRAPSAVTTSNPDPDSPAPSRTSASAAPAAAATSSGAVGSVIRFSRGDTHVDVTVTDDTTTTRAFLALLPTTVDLEEHNGREKVAYLDDPLPTDGVRGSDPEDGDLIYFTPWGNIGFYYNADGIGFDDRVIRLGTYSADLAQLTALEGSARVERLTPPTGRS